MVLKIPKKLRRRGMGNWKKQESLYDSIHNPNKEEQALRSEKNLSKPKHSKIKEKKKLGNGVFKTKEKKFSVKMLRDLKASEDGVSVHQLEKGKIYDLPESMARRFIEKKLAEKINKKSKEKE